MKLVGKMSGSTLEIRRRKHTIFRKIPNYNYVVYYVFCTLTSN